MFTDGPDKLIIEQISVEKLKKNPKTPETHSVKQIRKMADSIKIFRFNNPILIDSENIVIAGHGRLAAAKLLGITEVPVIRLQHLTLDQLRAYALADNQIATLAGWDKQMLAIELQNLAGVVDFDIHVTGFDLPVIDLALQTGKTNQTTETITIDERLPPVTKLGDRWQLGNHVIVCGNALELTSYQELMGPDLAQMVITDPPYNVPITGMCRARAKQDTLNLRWPAAK